MSLTAGTRLGPYEILSALGAGGMGEVYRARDTRLDRTVAIKVLPEHLASDPQFRERFDREARAISQLDHPHICALYDVGEQAPSTGSEQAVAYLVMQYLEGETLQDRLTKGALSLDQALTSAIQVADALDKAHRRGIVHRDLKPGNIMLTRSGAKLLDFGLAKVRHAGVTGAVALSAVPTVSSPFGAVQGGSLTGAGSILGTFQYMAPEQLEGAEADARTDIFAFGAVVFEMVTGRKAFEGKSQASLIHAIMGVDPPAIATLQPLASPALERAVKTCLAKNPEDRWQSAADLRRELQWIESRSVSATASPEAALSRRATGRERVAWIAAACLLIGLLAMMVPATLHLREGPSRDLPEMRLQIVTPPAANAEGDISFALSPDGRHVVFQARTEATTQLWLRPVDSETARPLPGTENAVNPFWSPDSTSVGFYADQQLKRIDISRGRVQTIIDAPGLTGSASWSDEGSILFVRSGTIYRVAAAGGEVAQVTTLAPPAQNGHRFPEFLPGGRRFLFYVFGTPASHGVYVGSLDSSSTKRLVAADSRAAFVPPDLVVFLRQGTLLGQRVDLERLEPVGDPAPVSEGISVNPSLDASLGLSTTTTGALAYRPSRVQSHQLSWVDRSGKPIADLGAPDWSVPRDPRLSPDGRTVALTRDVNGNEDVWLVDVARGIPERLTFDETDDTSPVWSPDGRRIAFHSDRISGGGRGDLFIRSLSGGRVDELLLESSENKNMLDWSPDGRFILYLSTNPKTRSDLWALPLEGDRKPFVVVRSEFTETGARFSPDSRWIAYTSNQTGRNEAYVHAFPGPSRSWQISADGGSNSQWGRSGREIFYRGADGRLMAAPVMLDEAAPNVEVGTPVPLFASRSVSSPLAAPDGQRFLVISPTGDAAPSPITILLNWSAGTGQ